MARPDSVVLVGLGNLDRADDGCGIILAENVKARFPERAFSEKERAVESIVLDLLEKEEVNAILFLDAADFGGSPGDIRLFGPEDAESFQPAFSSHKVPMTLLMQIITQQGKYPFLLAIQPETLEFLGRISPVISRRIVSLSELLQRWFEER